MDRNEIVKALYKQNPTACFRFIRMGVAYYDCVLGDFTKVEFQVPVNDMGGADFLVEMDSKHFIRWITNWFSALNTSTTLIKNE
jgi:hypothetical protein